MAKTIEKSSAFVRGPQLLFEDFVSTPGEKDRHIFGDWLAFDRKKSESSEGNGPVNKSINGQNVI